MMMTGSKFGVRSSGFGVRGSRFGVPGSAFCLVPCACCLAVVLAGAALGAAQQPTFSSRVEGVRVDVLVTDGGRPVTGLGAADFDVRDNGVPQTVDLVDLGEAPVSIVMVLDLSSSLVGSRLVMLQRAGVTLLEALGPQDQAALLSFNTAVAQRVPLTRDLGALRGALLGTTADGDTSLIDAALAGMLVGDTEGGRTLVVIFSDGIDTASFTPAEVALGTARRVNGVVYGVAASDDDARFLRDLTAATGGRVLEIGETGNPGPAFLEILQEFRRRYVLTYTPSGVTRGGWHQLSVRVRRGGARVQARPGYFSTQP
jgi:Ca-activated chloride channel family protein